MWRLSSTSTVRRRLIRLAGFGALFTALWCAGCARPDVAGEPEAPPLRVGFRPSDTVEDPNIKRYQALARYLEERLKLAVELVPVAPYGPTIEALRVGSIDMIWLGSLQYLLAEEEGLAQAIVMQVSPEHEVETYHSVFITHAESKLARLPTPAEAADLALVFTDPRSTSGALVPLRSLEQLNLSPQDFRSFSYAGNHSLAILTVAHREADLAAVSENRFLSLRAGGKITSDALRVIWRSPAIPSGPIAVRSGLAPTTVAALKHALEQWKTSAPHAWATFFPEGEDQSRQFAPYEPEVHAALRQFVHKNPIAP